MRHYAHYVKRQVVNPDFAVNSNGLQYVEKQPPEQGLAAPVYHSVSLNSGVAARVEVGDTIWLFSQLTSPWGRLPPSLDARIDVSRIDRDGQISGRYRYEAAQTSKWYPLCDATEIISGLTALNVRGEVSPLLAKSNTAIGQAVHFLRELSDGESLIRHSTFLIQSESDFISYRIADGTKPAYQLVESLLKEKRVVFWDRWSLPRRLAERKGKIDPQTLDLRIQSIINSSRVVWGGYSPRYGEEGSYSALERELAIEKGIFRPYHS